MAFRNRSAIVRGASAWTWDDVHVGGRRRSYGVHGRREERRRCRGDVGIHRRRPTSSERDHERRGGRDPPPRTDPSAVARSRPADDHRCVPSKRKAKRMREGCASKKWSRCERTTTDEGRHDMDADRNENDGTNTTERRRSERNTKTTRVGVRRGTRR